MFQFLTITVINSRRHINNNNHELDPYMKNEAMLSRPTAIRRRERVGHHTSGTGLENGSPEGADKIEKLKQINMKKNGVIKVQLDQDT